jgi:hypothetical protein
LPGKKASKIMDYKFFYKSFLKIIFTPEKAWDIILTENRSDKDLRNNFLLPSIVLVTIAAFLGSIIFTNSRLSVIYSIFTGVKYFILLLFVTYSSALVMGEITKPLDLGKNFTISFRLIVYSLTPMFFCLIASHVFESLIFVNILSLYGMYIFWTGAEKLLLPPDYKKMPMLIAIFVFITGIFFAGNWVITALTDRISFSIIHHLVR